MGNFIFQMKEEQPHIITMKKIKAYKNQEREDIEDENVIKFEFVNRPLQIRHGQTIYNGSKSQNTGIGHYAVIVKTVTDKLYTIHMLQERNVVIDQEQEKYTEKKEIGIDDFTVSFTISDIFEACDGTKDNMEEKDKAYSITKNNCIDAQNRVKKYLRGYLKTPNKIPKALEYSQIDKTQVFGAAGMAYVSYSLVSQ